VTAPASPPTVKGEAYIRNIIDPARGTNRLHRLDLPPSGER
jgi:hypothetical protein